jgi:hypothetical protein
MYGTGTTFNGITTILKFNKNLLIGSNIIGGDREGQMGRQDADLIILALNS